MINELKYTQSTTFNLTLWWTVTFILIKLFECQLINSFSILLYGIMSLVGYWGLFILLILSAVYWSRKTGKVEKPFGPFVFSLIATSFMLLFPFTALTLQVDFRLKQDAREEVVRMIMNKQINYDLTKTSRVDIPDKYENLSVGSPNVVVEKVDGEVCILFYTFRGLTDNSSGFVYVPNENTMTKFKLRQYSNSIFYDPIEITNITDHWYFVANT
ncbi:hypothetical protein [Hymenobacter cavernae]|nr:hypothetical protein [Hymenobacter cavernae]